MTNQLKIIITGSTGMVGEGVLIRCLQSNYVEKILVINRRHLDYSHPKLIEIIPKDFYDLSEIESQLNGYDACFFCLGISSVGISNDEYTKITHTLTLNIAKTLSRLNPEMCFTYVSGQSTDSSEIGRSAWARVKGKTENDLRKLPFKSVFAYRPGFMLPIDGQKNALAAYKYLKWLYPAGRYLYPNGFNKLQEVGDSMIAVSLFGFGDFILNGKEISETAKLID